MGREVGCYSRPRERTWREMRQRPNFSVSLSLSIFGLEREKARRRRRRLCPSLSPPSSFIWKQIGFSCTTPSGRFRPCRRAPRPRTNKGTRHVSRTQPAAPRRRDLESMTRTECTTPTVLYSTYHRSNYYQEASQPCLSYSHSPHTTGQKRSRLSTCVACATAE